MKVGMAGIILSGAVCLSGRTGVAETLVEPQKTVPLIQDVDVFAVGGINALGAASIAGNVTLRSGAVLWTATLIAAPTIGRRSPAR